MALSIYYGSVICGVASGANIERIDKLNKKRACKLRYSIVHVSVNMFKTISIRKIIYNNATI